MRSRSLLLALALCGGSALAPTPADAEAVLLVLQKRSCPQCKLQDADLVHADLRDADLSGAQLQRANLGQARLDGADLRGADLSFTSLRGASLRGANLEGARLYGTDLRESDLSGVRLDQGALEEAHWQDALGIASDVQSHASLHNAGVEAAQAGRWPKAETLFGKAIRSKPNEPLSWVARGISRSEQAKDELAATDFIYASSLYKNQGNPQVAEQLTKAAAAVQKRRSLKTDTPSGNGWGGQLLSGLFTAAQALAPLAIKAFAPMSGLGF
jgi:tetratricopeptide (TPR) repeat protein